MKFVAEALIVWSCLLTSAQCVLEMLSTGGDFSVLSGQYINLQCRFRMSTFTMFENPITWSKTQNNFTYRINEVGTILQPFFSEGRFSLRFENHPPVYALKLTIQSLRREDEGEYKCEVRSDSSTVLGAAYYSVVVKERVEGVRITMGNSTALEDKFLRSINFIHGQEYSIKCVVSGGYPFPDIEMFVGGRNVTEMFRLYRMCRTRGYGGLQGTHCDLQRWTDKYQPDLRDDSNALACVAKVPGLDPVTAETDLQVYYAPLVFCSPATADVGDKNISITCQIRSKPRVSSLYWILDSSGTRLEEGETVKDSWTEVNEQSDSELELRLYFGVVAQQNFRRYEVVAENQIGSTTSEVELSKGYPHSNERSTRWQSKTEDYRPYAPMTDINASPATLPSYLLNIVLILLSFVFQSLHSFAVL